ncbi:hypothetical protein HCH_02869 [Hahella chejuensis KCTC 2396]|uniref:Uncharacterized protein n=1 Tax=Hahella chejuensis (strain KCTC 2396) TaxID=349521 RepID=Q2SI79_HAHCH|nr:helix-turn-helix transcriptional regulator [Hahella chejuensis]ABC29645.1 hypothetical protein HCH_02869 [Hahella chejuensis KCTC 2396]
MDINDAIKNSKVVFDGHGKYTHKQAIVILLLIARYSTERIAAALGVGVPAVKQHLQASMHNVRATDRTDLVAQLFINGYLRPRAETSEPSIRGVKRWITLSIVIFLLFSPAAMRTQQRAAPRPTRTAQVRIQRSGGRPKDYLYTNELVG